MWADTCVVSAHFSCPSLAGQARATVPVCSCLLYGCCLHLSATSSFLSITVR